MTETNRFAASNEQAGLFKPKATRGDKLAGTAPRSAESVEVRRFLLAQDAEVLKPLLEPGAPCPLCRSEVEWPMDHSRTLTPVDPE